MPMIASIIGIIACTWYVTVRSVKKGIEKFCSIFLPILFVLLIGFLVFIAFLPGSWNGFAYFLTPQFRLLLDPSVWLAAFGHVFFSFSLALAIIVGYSRYIDKDVNIARSMMCVVIAEIFTSIIAGLVIFGGIGYMSYVQHVPFESVITSSLFGLGFVVFPQVIIMFPYIMRVVLGTIFFFCLFIAGITGLFSIVEAAAGNFEVEFGWTRRKAVTIITMMIFALSFLYVGGNGTYIIDALDVMVCGFNVILSGLLEIIVFMYCAPQIVQHEVWFTPSGTRAFRYYALKYGALVALCCVLISSLVVEFSGAMGLSHVIRWGWFAAASCLALACAYKKK